MKKAKLLRESNKYRTYACGICQTVINIKNESEANSFECEKCKKLNHCGIKVFDIPDDLYENNFSADYLEKIDDKKIVVEAETEIRKMQLLFQKNVSESCIKDLEEIIKETDEKITNLLEDYNIKENRLNLLISMRIECLKKLKELKGES
ncbi:MAG: hypothetical protein ABIJ17_02410 [Patescibacteria group bacterium]